MNSNGFGIGLGVGMLLGYRSGFLARPYSNTHGYNTYEDIHRREKYNRRKDGLLECAVANTTVYVKKLINIQGKLIYVLGYSKEYFTDLLETCSFCQELDFELRLDVSEKSSER